MISRRRQVVRRNAPLVLAIPWATWAALRITGAERGWPLVPAFAFTPHAAVTSLLPLGVAVATRSRLATGVAATSMLTLAAVVGQRAVRRPGAAPVSTAATGSAARAGAVAGSAALPVSGAVLRLASANLLVGRADPGAVVELVRAHDVDVLALQEVTPSVEAGLRAAGIGELLPQDHVVHARPGSPVGAGGAVFTRLPVLHRTVTPGRFEQPTVRLAVEGCLDVEVTAVHSEPPRSLHEVSTWSADLRQLPDPGPGVLRVLAGDYNATLDHAALRAVLARGYLDAAWAAGRAMTTTWTPLGFPHPRLVIDHVLVDQRIGVHTVQVLPIPGSDHRAVVAALSLPTR